MSPNKNPNAVIAVSDAFIFLNQVRVLLVADIEMEQLAVGCPNVKVLQEMVERQGRYCGRLCKVFFGKVKVWRVITSRS